MIALTRVRNGMDFLPDVLEHVKEMGFKIVAYDDASTDGTVEVLNLHCDGLIRNMTWESDPKKRLELETTQRQELLEFARAKFGSNQTYYYFDVDEFVELDSSVELDMVQFSGHVPFTFRLFDYYITEEDKHLDWRGRKYIGTEYRDIVMMWFDTGRESFYNRTIRGLKDKPEIAGYCHHYGKAVSVEHWEEKCEYYAKHTTERDVRGLPISEKWEKRKGKAIHTRSDFGSELITWDQKESKGVPNAY